MAIRFGIIGTGGIATDGHAPAINALKDAVLTAVLSRDNEKGAAFLAHHNAAEATAHTTLEAFAADPSIDAVIIASPDRLHAMQALACLKAGKDVLLEKPMATSSEDAATLVEVAAANKRLLGVGFHLREHNGHKLLHGAIHKDGAIGAIRHIRTSWTRAQQKNEYSWRAQTDLSKWWSLAAVGSHCIDIARWFAHDTDDWKQFTAITSNQLWGGEQDETAMIAAQFASGPTMEMLSSMQFGAQVRIEIYGEKGQAICEGTTRMGSQTIVLNGQPLAFTPENPFVAQLQRFVKSVETRQKPEADGMVGLRSVKDLLLARA